MFKSYKDIFFWSYVMIWLFITLTTWFITGDNTISVYVINPIMILIFAIIFKISLSNNEFANWLKTPVKK